MKLTTRVQRAIMRRLPREPNIYLYDYRRPDGTFDYERYRRVQTEGNKRKINNVFADQETIRLIADYCTASFGSVEAGLCHGCRNGAEVKWFREHLGPVVQGTDISDTAAQFDNMTQWDFHEANPDWIGKFDFVYTNSHDHAYDPKKAIGTWVDQLKPNGLLFLEHTPLHSINGTSELDPFGVRPEYFPSLILEFGAGKYSVREVIRPKHRKPNGTEVLIFVIHKH